MQRAYLALIYIEYTAVQYSMLELNNTRHTAFQRKDTKELDNGCHSHTSTAIEYIDLPINFVDEFISMKSEQNWVSDVEVETICR